MKIIKLIMLLVALAIASCGNPNPETTANAEIPESTEEQREFYQLKIYSFGSEEQVNATDAYLKNAFIPAVSASVNSVTFPVPIKISILGYFFLKIR